ncbi:MAG: aquaporin [Solirubrobacterales bacterium]|nr:aquaporin [Solirubrobacterales bacterium]
MQDRGLAAYIAELLGTFFLVFAITLVGVLFISVGDSAQFGSDYAVVGLTYAFVLTVLVFTLGGASGGHFNPAITIGAALMKKIAAVDAVIYILAQLSGGVLGALLTKALLVDEGRAANYGAATISPLLGGAFAGAVVEALGTFLLVLTVLVVALGVEKIREWAPLAIGLALGLVGLILVPLTGGSVNPARWFGPALVSGEFADAWAYIVGPVVGAVLAFVVYRFLIAPGSGDAESAKPSTIPSPEA